MNIDWDEEEIAEEAQDELEKHKKEFLDDDIIEFREEVRKNNGFTVWLGGPGYDNDLYPIRKLVREILENEGFEVIYSENLKLRRDLVVKELDEIERKSDLAILLAISPGASAEAIEFSQYDYLRSKISVFVPEEFEGGYVFRSLKYNSEVIDDECTFSLEKMGGEKPDYGVIKTIWERVDRNLMDNYRENIGV
ncbi:MAG: hypothetical protein ABEI86_11565 [Halobacteriaceae archaeon]